MKVLRRSAVAAMLLACYVCAAVQAQVLKQLPADPYVVIKVNNPQAVSQKVADMAKRLGLAAFQPALNDPLDLLKKQLNIKEGLDATGELAVALYDPAPNSPEPQVVVLIPVTDYKAFMGNLANVQQEGNLSKFSLPDENQPLYAVNWGKYAAVTPNKELLGQNPAGVSPTALSAKQLEGNDIVAWANMAKIRAVAQPQWQANKPNLLQMMDQGLAGNPQINQKFVPAIKALVNQLIVVMESGLNDTAGATFGLNLTKDGINTTFLLEFTPESYMGKSLAAYKAADQNMLAGLPNRKYFFFAGGTIDSAVAGKWWSDFSDPIVVALNGAGDDAKPILTMVNAAKSTLSSSTGFAMGYAQPTAPPGQQSVIQAVGVYRGDAQKIAEATQQSQSVMSDFMKLLPQNDGISFKYNILPGAKTVDGTKLDEVSMKFEVNANNPQAVQVGQMLQMMYGPNGLSGVMGPVDAKTVVFTMGGDDALNNDAVAAAKKQDTALSQQPAIAAVTKALPQNRIVVEYIALDNIADTVTKYMQQFGARVPVKIPTDLPPIGISIATEGPSLRVDSHISAELIENIVSTVIQGFMANQGGRAGQL